MSSLERSWGAFTEDRAREYLTSFGAPSLESREIVGDLLQRMAGEIDGPMRVLDLGCGNGGLYTYLRERGLDLRYVGVDFSEPLLDAARRTTVGAEFVRDDVEKLSAVSEVFDAVLYSHVLEMLSSPQASLLRAAELTSTIVIRFFEPPDGEIDLVELVEMDVGDRVVPYLRRTMSRDYYRLLLASIGCESVDVYRAEHAKDQVHVCTIPRR